jgi:hypothetical protein
MSYKSNGRAHRGGWNDAIVPDEKIVVEPPDRPLCRLRFQQTSVEVRKKEIIIFVCFIF